MKTKYTADQVLNAVMLNEHLIDKQKVSKENVEALKATHVLKYFLYKHAEVAAKSGDVATLIDLDGLRTDLEFFQQRLWGFPLDPSFHQWYTMPGCTCPKMDNAERTGTNYQITSETCPIHGA